VHHLDEETTDRTRDDEEDPLGDARGDVVDLGLPGCKYLDVLLAVWGISDKHMGVKGGQGGR